MAQIVDARTFIKRSVRRQRELRQARPRGLLGTESATVIILPIIRIESYADDPTPGRKSRRRRNLKT